MSVLRCAVFLVFLVFLVYYLLCERSSLAMNCLFVYLYSTVCVCVCVCVCSNNILYSVSIYISTYNTLHYNIIQYNIYTQSLRIGKDESFKLFEWTESLQLGRRFRQRSTTRWSQRIGHETVNGQNCIRQTGRYFL